MKRKTVLILCTAMLLMLCACGGSRNTLFAEASPMTSAMELQYFDGVDGKAMLLYDSAAEKEILAALTKVRAKKAENWSPKDVTYPVFGLEIGSKDGEGIQAAWCDGYLLMRDGGVYRFDFDFPAMTEKYEWETVRNIASAADMYCGRFLAEGADRWYPIHMTKVEAPVPPEKISMALIAAEPEYLTVELTNNSVEAWCFGEYFSLQVQLGDAWYAVPTAPDHNWGFHDIGLILEAGQILERTYSLQMYGNLPVGTYRLVVEGLTAEFVLK